MVLSVFLTPYQTMDIKGNLKSARSVVESVIVVDLPLVSACGPVKDEY